MRSTSGITFQYDLSSQRLLDARVHVADVGVRLEHLLAAQRHEQPQHPVRGGVVRPEVDREQLLLGRVRGAVRRLGGDARRPARARCRPARSLVPPRRAVLVVREQDRLARRSGSRGAAGSPRTRRASGCGAGRGGRGTARRTCRRSRAPGTRRSGTARRRSRSRAAPASPGSASSAFTCRRSTRSMLSSS